LVPDLSSQWKGATDADLEQIEQIAGRPLPDFYRWFLLRMGVSMGSIAYGTTDFSAAKVLSCYEEGLFSFDRRFLMIGYESDEMMPLHLLYDFDHPVREDAHVGRRLATGGALHTSFETLREMIAWGVCAAKRIEVLPQRCIGVLSDSDKNVLTQLGPVVGSLGFETPVPTGPYCAVYEGAHSAMISKCTPDVEPEFHVFRLAGNDAASLRRVLGEIVTETSLQVDIREWDPPLA
jgi:hypothetical protein